jgi:phospholipid/cholesterol/gamma-HCH transport system permease protein
MPKSLGKRLVDPVASILTDVGGLGLLLVQSFLLAFRRPYKLRYIVKQMEFIGVDSVLVVALTGLFTGAVLALQSYYGFRKFAAEGLVGATVALSMTRELGPILTSLMVTGRAGSAMAAELGSMRVTEQIDALVVMALNPVKYLIVPRVIASLIMLPILTVLADFVGIVGGYLVGVKLLGINEGAFISKMIKYVDLEDIYNGLIKAAVFGVILSVVSCYKGFYTKGGAEGVGRSTTEAVVLASVTILIADYFITSLLF